MWTVSPRARWIAVDECMVVFDPGINGFVELDEPGAELWRVLSSNRWAEQVAIDYVVANYDIDPREAGVMVADFVRDLNVNGIINRLAS